MPFGFPEPTNGGATGAGGGENASPRIGDTSPDATLRPMWPGLYEFIDAIV